MDSSLKDRLWAKSLRKKQWHDGIYLTNHIQDVARAVNSLLEVAGPDIGRFFMLDARSMEQVRVTALLAALWHDIGKANDGFQRAVKDNLKGVQQIRHEHLSAILMSLEEVRAWLCKSRAIDDNDKSRAIDDNVFQLARLVVAGHHLQLLNQERREERVKCSPFAEPLTGDGNGFTVLSTNDDFYQLLENMCKDPFNLSQERFSIPTSWHFTLGGSGESVRKWRDKLKDEFEEFELELTRDETLRRLLMASRTVLIASDAAASGLRRVDEKQDENWSSASWIEDTLNQVSTQQSIERIISKRKQEVEDRWRAIGEAREFIEDHFQQEAATLGKRALLLMPCGSGKTLAAYNWIKAQLSERGDAKAVFLYPTTGTATEGFKDYASHDAKAGLVHSRAVFDLTDMFTNPDDERSGRSYTSEKQQRLFALGFWGDTIFSATADAFLSFMQNNYTSICLLPVLARSVVVIDEVHSFDDAMFKALLDFLKTFDLPVLMMTASLPIERRRELEREIKGLRVYPNEGDASLTEIQTLADKPRYRISLVEKVNLDDNDIPLSDDDLFNTVRHTYQKGRKVLWVVNTVDRCIRIAQMLSDVAAICYHSRFVYEDRRTIHDDVVKKFKPTYQQGVIAVTTQVCEMSLDLDADILISELAPATSLIQRFGRCNREKEPRSLDASGQVCIYRVGKSLPYDEEAFQTGELFWHKLRDKREINQLDLAEALKDLPSPKARNYKCLFTEASWQAYSLPSFRITDDYAVAAILESQIKEFYKLERAGEPTTGLIVQAPRRLSKARASSWLRLVEDKTDSERIKYCKTYGLREVKQK
jgi:CRISPR-associated endonuclease/helicase Cas3